MVVVGIRIMQRAELPHVVCLPREVLFGVVVEDDGDFGIGFAPRFGPAQAAIESVHASGGGPDEFAVVGEGHFCSGVVEAFVSPEIFMGYGERENDF